MIQWYHFTRIPMKHFCFRLVAFFLHVKPDLQILVSGYSESFYFITFSQCWWVQGFSTSFLWEKINDC